MPLYQEHARALQVMHSDVEVAAQSVESVFPGTAGSVVERRNQAGYRFYAHQYYDGGRKRREAYIAGPVGDADAEAQAAELRARIQETKGLAKSLRMLGREGYALADARTFATLAALHNHGVFAAGGILVGSHAYGVILNRLGVRAAPYATEDVDLARREALALPPDDRRALLDVLRDSGIDFVAVPSLSRKQPPTSFKEKGRGQFVVDLLVPAKGEAFATVPVPELRAHATALPYFDYLLEETQPGALLAREGACFVRVPVPERYAVHKVLVAGLRTGRDAKSQRDLDQAAVLCAALADLEPGALRDARHDLPTTGRRRFDKAVPGLRDRLRSHEAALDELD